MTTIRIREELRWPTHPTDDVFAKLNEVVLRPLRRKLKEDGYGSSLVRHKTEASAVFELEAPVEIALDVSEQLRGIQRRFDEILLDQKIKETTARLHDTKRRIDNVESILRRASQIHGAGQSSQAQAFFDELLKRNSGG